MQSGQERRLDAKVDPALGSLHVGGGPGSDGIQSRLPHDAEGYRTKEMAKDKDIDAVVDE